MFNVNSIVHLCGSIYDAKKKGVVNAMKADTNEKWNQRGRRFEVFRPKHDHPEPSEWYITFYSLLRPATLLGINRRRRPEPEEPEVLEEGWVL